MPISSTGRWTPRPGRLQGKAFRPGKGRIIVRPAKVSVRPNGTGRVRIVR